MSKFSAEEIKSSILDHVFEQGIKPGSLLVAKKSVGLDLFFGEKRMLGRHRLQTKWVMFNESDVILFVDVHGVRSFSPTLGDDEDGPWDFWYEVLVFEQTAYVHAFELGKHKLNNFDIHTVK